MRITLLLDDRQFERLASHHHFLESELLGPRVLLPIAHAQAQKQLHVGQIMLRERLL